MTVRQGKARAAGVGDGPRLCPGPPINFTNEVVPIFTKLGCNGGGVTVSQWPERVPSQSAGVRAGP